MYEQKISSTGHNTLELFYVPLYPECLSDLHKKFQVASTDDAHEEW